MTRFGLVTEGITDQEVLINLLYGFFNRDDLPITRLQPLPRQNPEERPPAGWFEVLRYCASSDFRQAFQAVDYVIVHIDTDCSEEKHYDVPHREDGRELTPDKLVDRVVERLQTAIGPDFFSLVADRIILGISVHTVECWLLPLFYSNQRTRRAKITGYLSALNQALNRKWQFTIDAQNKDPVAYRDASRGYSDHRTLISSGHQNPSLSRFLGDLAAYNIDIDSE